MNAFQNCQNTSDLIPLYLPLQLYLKPIARLNISIQLPKLKKLGKSISHWEIMDKLRNLIKPDEFTLLKVTKTTIEFVRFEGEVETRLKLKNIISKIDNKMIQLKSLGDLLRIRAMEWKSDFPHRRVWDNFFQNSKDMDEMKPGERPDTIYFSNLPTKWFSLNHSSPEEIDKLVPSEKVVFRIFEKFGTIRFVDIPVCDPYRNKMKSHISGFKNDLSKENFECYVQFKDYIGFSKTMDAFRDMTLVHKGDDGIFQIDIKVDFDKSKHLSDASIKRREIVRDRLINKAKEKEARDQVELEEKKRKEQIERQREEDLKQQKQLRRRLREEKRKAKILEKLEVSGTDEINEKIAKEEKKLMRVQRKLEAIRLVEELFRRIKDGSTDNIKHSDMENDKIKKFKNASELEVLNQREKLHNAIKGRVMLKNLLFEEKRKTHSSASDTSLSLEDVDMTNEAVIKKYPELLYDPAWFGLQYHLPPGSILSNCSDLTPMGRGIPRGNPFVRFSSIIRPPRGIHSRRGNSQRGFRGGYRQLRSRQYNSDMEAYRRYFSHFLNESTVHRGRPKRSYSSYVPFRTRSRSRSRRRSYSRSRLRSHSRDVRSRSRSRSRSKSRPRSRSRPRPRSKSRTRSKTRSISRSRSRTRSTSSRKSYESSSNKIHSGSSKQKELEKGKRNKSKHKKSKERSHIKETRSKSVDSSGFTSPKEFSQKSDSFVSNSCTLPLEQEKITAKTPEK